MNKLVFLIFILLCYSGSMYGQNHPDFVLDTVCPELSPDMAEFSGFDSVACALKKLRWYWVHQNDHLLERVERSLYSDSPSCGSILWGSVILLEMSSDRALYTLIQAMDMDATCPVTDLDVSVGRIGAILSGIERHDNLVADMIRRADKVSQGALLNYVMHSDLLIKRELSRRQLWTLADLYGSFEAFVAFLEQNDPVKHGYKENQFTVRMKNVHTMKHFVDSARN